LIKELTNNLNSSISEKIGMSNFVSLY